MIERAYIIRGFFRCQCGKIHQYGGISITSVCTCGRKLKERVK